MTAAARGYSWASATQGNQLAVTHGAYSPRKVDPLAGDLVTLYLDAAAAPHSAVAYLADPSYRPALWSWARTEARIQLLQEWLADHGGDVDDDGNVRQAAELLTRLERQAMDARARLGLDPLSRAKLGKDVAIGRHVAEQAQRELQERYGRREDVEEESSE